MPPDTREAEIARNLADRFELLERIGRGGFASVFRVRNTRLDRVEALKVLSEGLTEDADFARRFEQEARVAASLDHPNIVKVYDFSASRDFFWFSMQYIEGPSLGKLTAQTGPLDEAAVARIALGVLDALEYSHARGVIHRDIKPDNILLDPRNRPYLTDFGVAKSALALVHTHAGTLLGSPVYMSPEQLQGQALEGSSDLYSLGITMYKALSGTFPFTADDTLRAAMKRLTHDPEPLSRRRPGVSSALEAIVMKVLARSPADRFRSAPEMKTAVEAFLAETASAVSAVSRGAPAPATPRERETTETLDLAGLPEPPATPASAERSTAAPIASGARRAGRARLVLPLLFGLAGAIALAAAAVIWASRGAVRPRPLQGVPSPAPAPSRAANTAPATPIPAPTAPVEPSPTAAPAEAIPPAPSPAASVAPAAAPEARLRRPTRRPASAAIEPNQRAARPPAPPPAEAAAPPLPRSARVPPKLLSDSPLVIAEDVRRAHRNATVGLLITVAEDGTVKDAVVVSELCDECDRAALAAVRRYRFQPAQDAEGRPIEARIAIALRF